MVVTTLPVLIADTPCVTPFESTMFQLGDVYPLPVATELAVPVIELATVGTELTTDRVDDPVNVAVDVCDCD